jgi:hypothetical protein
MATYDRTLASRASGDLRGRPLHLHWWAVFGGTVIGWGLLFFLSLLGLAIGLAPIEPYSAHLASGLDLGSAIWGIAVLVLCSIVGAYLVVRIAGERRRREAALHGAVSWSLSMLAGALLATPAGNAAREAAGHPARTTARAEASGNLRMTQRDRNRLEEARSAAAKTAGGGAAGAFLSFVGALLGAGLGTSQASGPMARRGRRGRRARREAPPRDGDLGRTSTVGGELPAGADRADPDHPTIISPPH